MTPRYPSLSSMNDVSLADTPTYQPKPTSAHPSRCTSDSALNVPASPMSTRSEVQDAVFIKPRRRISFDERVSVREFESNSWVSVKDMEQLSPIGGSIRGRNVISVPKIIVCPKDSQGYQDEHMDSLYSQCPMLPGLQDGSSNKPVTLPQLLHREIRSILMVDPHDIFLSLFSKRLQEALPHVHILTAHSSEEALQLLSKQTFDIIITEERLSLFHRHTSRNKLASGSALLSHLRSHHVRQFQHSLLVGVSAHWQSDHATMAQSGADYCWSKAPPPTFHRTLLEEMMHTLLSKRGKHELAKEFMMHASSAVGGNAVTDNQRQ